MACRAGAEPLPRRAPYAALAGLLACVGTAGAAPAPAPAADEASPLVAFVATLDAAAAPAQERGLADLRRAEAALARSPGPDADCAQSLGAARHGALRAAVAQARQALGERQAAIGDWQRALDCEPRNARYRVALASVLLTFAQLDAARAQAERAATLAPGQPGLEELQARLAYLAGRWLEAAARAQRIATRLQGAAATEPGPDAPADAAPGDDVAVFWWLQAQFALRRGGQPRQDLPGPDPAIEERWPVPLWRFVRGELDERDVVAAIAARPEPRRRREMACEALYYTAQHALAAGRVDEGRRRLARVVNLKVLYYVEHDMALAELATLRSP